MNKTFVVVCRPGPAWVAGKPSREQPYWNEHAGYMEELFQAGILVLGGPYADYSGIHLILEAADKNAVLELLELDPFIQYSILTPGSIDEWLIFLDASRRA